MSKQGEDHVASGWDAEREYRWIEAGDLQLHETREGAVVRINGAAPQLTATELAGLARELSGWFADDPSETIDHVEKCATHVKIELEKWNARARIDEVHPPYDELTRALDSISEACRRLREHAIYGRRPEKTERCPEKTDLSLLRDAGAKDHPAYPAFCGQMRGRVLGEEELNSAWSFFKKGWGAQ